MDELQKRLDALYDSIDPELLDELTIHDDFTVGVSTVEHNGIHIAKMTGVTPVNAIAAHIWLLKKAVQYLETL